MQMEEGRMVMVSLVLLSPWVSQEREVLFSLFVLSSC